MLAKLYDDNKTCGLFENDLHMSVNLNLHIDI